ncbi:MAG TPA: hypothetical protein VK939_17520 [Longimicrobiales bacterium]|nr:hypothetical protein [Longimicrobiales bacterium]
MMVRTILALLLAALAAEAAAAQTGPAWNSARALELVERARERRQIPQADTTLHNYSARAEGFVYFYLDRTGTAERTLVKTDQVALELYWAQPDRSKQRIVGLRDASRLPNRMHYHLDHLTVVQNGFGDLIRIGDGDEVSDVPHPAAPGSAAIYDFRVADSLELRLPSATEPIRVYEINVRPKRNDRSALVGSIFVDRATADIVRMTFTFTPASYVDRRLDYIHISLDNGLWEGRYWLPNEQRVEIRRQIPELDFAAGAVIQGRMRITDYTFNDTLPDRLFRGLAVEAVPPAEREAYPFERGIYDDLADAGLGPVAELADLRAQAAALLRTHRLSGLPSLRPHLPSASSALRYNRAEGLFLGGGLTYAPGGPRRVDATLGYAFGAERPGVGLTLRDEAVLGGALALRGYLNDMRDIGLVPPIAPALNTLAAAFLGDDYLDLHYASGAELGWRRAGAGAWQYSAGGYAERHRRATLAARHAPFDSDAGFRPVRPVDEGSEFALRARLQRPLPDSDLAWGSALTLRSGWFERDPFARADAAATLRVRTADHSWSLLVRASAGIAAPAAAQHLFVLGGVGTLPGYTYRAFAGERFGLLQAEASQDVLAPWIRLRVLAALGSVGGIDAAAAPAVTGWSVTPTRGMHGSAGAGVSLFWDILRIDRYRGLNGGRWVFQISASPEFADIS